MRSVHWSDSPDAEGSLMSVGVYRLYQKVFGTKFPVLASSRSENMEEDIHSQEKAFVVN